MKIAFIGFGEAARAFAGSLSGTDDLRFSAYDILLPDAGMQVVADELDVLLCNDIGAALKDADWIISAVTADQSLIAAHAARSQLTAGAVFIDINSVSAQRKRDTAGLVQQTGAAYVDMAVMAPVHPRGHKTPVLLAGETDRVTNKLTELGFDFDVVSDTPGDATAIKMIRSLFVKGLEAITVQALLAADAAGCSERVYDSLSGSFAALDWPKFPRYQLERVATHGTRRAAEMRESAATMRDLGFDEGGDLAAAIAALHDVIGAKGIDLSTAKTLDEAIKALRG